MEILMVQPWQKVARQKITHSFSPNPEISFPPLGEEDGTEGPIIIEAKNKGPLHTPHVCGWRVILGNTWRSHMANGADIAAVKIRDAEHSASTWMNFVVVRSPSSYNRIIGRPGVRKIQAVPSTAHGILQFPVLGGVLTLRSSRIIPLECTMVSGLEVQSPDVVQATEERIKVAIHPEYPKQTIAIGSTITEDGRKALCDLLRHNLDIFAWKPANMTGVLRHIAEHRLNVREGYSPVSCIQTNETANSSTANTNRTNGERVTNCVPCGGTRSEVEEELLDPWTLFTDGSSCVDGSGAGLILTDPEGSEFTYALRFKFDATNNEAKYEAIIAGLRIAEQMGVKNLQASVDSHLVANQHARRNKICGSKGNTDRILLAHNACGCKKTDPGMSRLPGPPPRAKKPATKADSYYRFASVKHPQASGLVERENISLGEGIKARLDERSKDWIEKVPHVFWAHRTMIKLSNGDTPFLLTYRTEAVIPVEIGMPTFRTEKIDIVQNNEALEINLDLLEERREQAAIYEARSKAKMEKYYNSKVRNTSFRPGDLVYRNNDARHAKDSGKLSPKWEGSYEVTKALGNGAYKLKDHNGKHISRTWNVRNLKKCYVHAM
ncbi:reverse transcriptase domain-containing protein [Tanacetum coccineum]